MNLQLYSNPNDDKTRITVPSTTFAKQTQSGIQLVAEVTVMNVLNSIYAFVSSHCGHDELFTLNSFLLVARTVIKEDITKKDVAITGDFFANLTDGTVSIPVRQVLHLIGEYLFYPEEASILHSKENTEGVYRIAYSKVPIEALELQRLLDTGNNRWDTEDILTVSNDTIEQFCLSLKTEHIVSKILSEFC